MFWTEQWTNAAKLSEGPILRSIDRGEKIGSTLGGGQIIRIYKQLARQAGLDSDLITRISRHSFRVGGGGARFIGIRGQHARDHAAGWAE
jgi:hypothetical protein